jgi:undecaprenyl-diphosphatase
MSMQPRPALWLMPVWAITISVVLFTALALVASGTRTIPGDEAIFDFVQKTPTQPGLFFADLGNILGATPTTPVALAALAGFAFHRKSQQAIILCLSAGILRFAGSLLKRVVDSPRPTVEFGFVRAEYEGLGFPSGHAFTAGIVAGATTIVLLHLVAITPRVKVGLALIWLWAALCCFARIWFGAHWPSDVVGGLLAATFVIGVSTHLANFLDRKLETA